MPGIKKRFVPLLLSVLALVIVASCGDDESEPDLSQDTQEMRFALSNLPSTLDPAFAVFSQDLALVSQLFRGLLWYDEDLELIPMAAREVPTEDNGGISSDGLVYTFRLRDDLTWSDGAPLTSVDFEFSLKRLLDPRTGAPYASYFFNVTGAEQFASAGPDADASTLDNLRGQVGIRASDPHTLVITMNSPQPILLHSLAHPAAMPVRQDIVEAHGETWATPQNIVSNGPFVVGEFTESQRIVLTRNPNYWLEPSRLETLIFLPFEDANVAFSEYLAGNVDYVALPPEPDVVSVVDGDPGLKEQSHTLTQLTSVEVVFNNTRAPFDDERVRKAFAMAVDRALVIERFQPGGVRTGFAWIPDGMPDYDEDLGKEWALNPDKAKDLLAEAGYPDGHGLPPIVFAHPESQASLATALQEQLEQNLGVRIELQTVSLDESRSRLFAGDYQLASFGWTAAVPDPGIMLVEPYGCQRYEGDSCAEFPFANRAQYANPEFDRLMAQASKELDEDRRLEIYSQAHEMMVNDVPAIFLGTLIRRYMVKPYVKELIAVPIDQEFPGSYFLDKTYIQGRDEED